VTDIVERLRDALDTCDDSRCKVREARSGCTCAAAADEIERLRDALAKARAGIALLREALAIARAEALEEAKQLAENFTEMHHAAHDMASGIFPKRSKLRDAIAAAIARLKETQP
jgi:hypothetical protein